MSKSQQIIDLFQTHDQDHDGQINATQFGALVTDLGYDYIYPGSINKMIRKLNYLEPDKTTINLEQAKQYAESLSSHSQHAIWKEKYNILQWTHEVKTDMLSGLSSEKDNEAAAPGVSAYKWDHDNSVHNAQIKVLVGQQKPHYLSEIKIEVDKNQGGPKVKPFIKLKLAYNMPDKAKKMESLFKQNFATILKMIGQEDPDWAEEMNNFHINSFVQGNSVTFFFTTVNEEMVSLIQLFSQMFELIFGSQSNAKAFLNFQFEYDFINYFEDKKSNFYDIFVKDCRLHVNAKAQHFIREFKRLFFSDSNNFSGDVIEQIIPVALFHIDTIDADIQFDSFDGQTQYELETREDINQGLKQIAGFFMQLEDGGMDIKGLLELLDAEITIEASVGEWHGKSYFRLKNINKLILSAFTTYKEKGTVQVKEKGQGSESESCSDEQKPKKPLLNQQPSPENNPYTPYEEMPKASKIPKPKLAKQDSAYKSDSSGSIHSLDLDS